MTSKIDRSVPYACAQCKVVKNPEEFVSWRPYWCKPCNRKKGREYTSKRLGREIKPIKVWDGEYRECSICGHKKHKSDFSTVLYNKKRIPNSACRICVRDRGRERMKIPETKEMFLESSRKSYLKNGGKERALNWRLKKEYGITLEERDAMLLANGSKCPICETKEPNPYWAVDHCHRTGKVRGVICSRCNSLLGMAKDNIFTLQSAITYLSNHYFNQEPVEGVEGFPKPDEELEEEAA